MRLSSALWVATVAACATFAGVAHAAPTGYAFDTVDNFSRKSGSIDVTGVLRGETAPSTHGIQTSDGALAACERMLSMSMAKPGRYRVYVDNSGSYPSCSIERR